MKDLLGNLFVLGFLLGLLLCLITVLNIWWRNRTIARENRRLKDSLSTKFSIEAESSERIKKDLEALRKENENLRISVQTWMQKPKREDLRLLHVYDRAISKMQEKAPGFAQAWLVYLREAEQEIDETTTGKVPFLARLMRPSSAPSLPRSTSAEPVHPEAVSGEPMAPEEDVEG